MSGKAVAYLRVSGRGQRAGDGFPRQRSAVRRAARRMRVEIVAEFCDTTSGTKAGGARPGLAALLDRLDSNGIRVVLVERADRVARDLIVSETILGQFRSRGVRVVDSEGVDLTVGNGNPTLQLIRQVLGAVAMHDKNLTVLKLRAARERIRRARGRCEGRKAYGSDPSERATVERILTLRAAGRGRRRASFAAIAGELNRDGIPARAGGRWFAETVRRVYRRARAGG